MWSEGSSFVVFAGECICYAVEGTKSLCVVQKKSYVWIIVAFMLSGQGYRWSCYNNSYIIVLWSSQQGGSL